MSCHQILRYSLLFCHIRHNLYWTLSLVNLITYFLHPIFAKLKTFLQCLETLISYFIANLRREVFPQHWCRRNRKVCNLYSVGNIFIIFGRQNYSRKKEKVLNPKKPNCIFVRVKLSSVFLATT